MHNWQQKPNLMLNLSLLVCFSVGSCSVSGAGVDQPGTADASREGISGSVYTVLHAQGSNAASCSAEPVR